MPFEANVVTDRTSPAIAVSLLHSGTNPFQREQFQAVR
jgi:hypothetical protein